MKNVIKILLFLAYSISIFLVKHDAFTAIVVGINLLLTLALKLSIKEEIGNLSYEDLLKEQNIAKILGYDIFSDFDEAYVYTKGYRILNKIPRMPSTIVDNLAKSFKSLQHIIDATIEELDNVEEN